MASFKQAGRAHRPRRGAPDPARRGGHQRAEGEAKFIRFKDIVFATGSRPAALADLPFDGTRVLDSTDALALASLPKTLAIVGAGYIGLEIGIALAKLGSRVTMAEAESGILPGLDRRLVRPVERRLAELGVEVLVSARVRGLEKGKLTVELAAGARKLAADKVVVAVGRRPNADDLGLENAGISADASGLLKVAPDRRLAPHIAAIGDITSGPALAHKATAEAAVAVAALNGARAAFQPAAIPAVIFSTRKSPPPGSARPRPRPRASTSRSRTSSSAPRAARPPSARATVSCRSSPTARAIPSSASHRRAHASELIAEGVLAIELGASLEDLALTIHAHPTLSEQYPEAAHLASASPCT